MSPALLVLGAWLSAAWAEDKCKDAFNGITPTEVTVYSGGQATFRISVTDVCRSGWTCEWSVDRGGGSLSATEGRSVTWYAPEDPPEDCVPDYMRVYADCWYLETFPYQDEAEITLRCTPEEKDALRQSRYEASVSGGGCGPAPWTSAAAVLPLGLLGWGNRRRKRPSTGGKAA